MYIDDILVTDRNEKEHLEHLQEVLRRLKEVGMHFKSGKCEYLLTSEDYLGHTISKEGLHTSDAKVEAILQVPLSKNIAKL